MANPASVINPLEAFLRPSTSDETVICEVATLASLYFAVCKPLIVTLRFICYDGVVVLGASIDASKSYVL